MPRKQRFKPSRKPKTIDTPVELTTLGGSPPIPPLTDPPRSREVTPDDRGGDSAER